MQNLTLPIDGEIKGTKPSLTKHLKKLDTSDDSRDFLALILQNISKNTGKKDITTILAKTAKSDKPKLSIEKNAIFDNTNFMQILSLIEFLNTNQPITKFPTLSGTLTKLLEVEQNLNEIKSAKNILDLIKLSDKFNLGLSKITITKENLDTLKKEFITLNSKGFFDFNEVMLDNFSKQRTAKIETATAAADISKSPLQKLISSQNQPVFKTEPKKESKIEIRSSATNKNKEVSVEEYLAKITQKALKESNTTPKTEQNTKQSEIKTPSLSGLLNKEDKTDTNQPKEATTDSLAIKDTIASAKIHTKQNQNQRTLSSFANDLQEKISEYKPPITRFHITLNPANLGEVEVTMLNRGSNLHINFTSNNQVMQIFLQNQAEFKNSLVNMGFTELSMNFSDQRGQNNSNDQRKLRPNNNDKNGGDEQILSEQSIEIVIAKYV